jgi:hypothetical protein
MHALMRLNKYKYALKYALHYFSNAIIFINKYILLNILVHNNSTNILLSLT